MIPSTLQNILLPAIVGGGTAFAAIKFLGKRLIEHRLEKDIENFKTQLALRTEALKTELAIYAHEQSIMLSRVDAQKAEAIQKVYSVLVLWNQPVSQLVAGSPIRDGSDQMDLHFYKECAEKAHLIGKQLIDELVRNAIYFDPAIYKLMAETITSSIDAVASFLSPIRAGEAVGVDYEVLLEHMEKQRAKLVQLHKEKILPLHQDLIQEFRMLLGVVSEKRSN
jgi:hypothetical protein